ncbi:ABC transporter ATP-binding protein [Flavobacterium sp. HSC-61S13]|uniref:ABC transporter ATP-binding protein n=1 Tax=Flavobacterium sp. HSC-61S13 TaxID=2910963 RepID=UPI00209FB477|nr:ABC transporter ATP-binding protein [Flavobacterium sp. HSC-61S13]MCP1995314.1 peptide/nickel transport system ATP-binding protein [Flavobacterium sp. HSC-61S13]
MSLKKVLEVNSVAIDFKVDKIWKPIVKRLSFYIGHNEIVGIVGESGSGKSVTSLALMGLLPQEVSRISNGEIVFGDVDLTKINQKEWRGVRGQKIAMIFQEPMSSLNPSMTCGLQVAEMLMEHTSASKKEIRSAVISLFEKVKLPNPEEIFIKYPHQISGGQKQRVMIAMAIACKPELLIADEPTTALDVTVQQEIITLLRDLQQETGMSILFITHDLALISEIAHRTIVLYQGEIVEQGLTTQIFENPTHIYTRALIKSRPSLDYRLDRLPTISDFLNNTSISEIVTDEERQQRHEELYKQSPLLEVRDLGKTYFNGGNWFRKKEFQALSEVNLKIYEGETLGLVGESGCGKSTLGNAILQLDPATSGTIFYRGQDITKLSKSHLRALRKEIQIIFQDPYSSLNPRITVGKAIMEPMKVHGLYGSDRERKMKTIEILERVGLDESCFNRYSHEFSGGQRQRIGIARTIALQPKLIVCDESVSALDISVQAQVLNLLNELKENFGFTYLFISHDLAVVKYMSDQVAVMSKGQIVEMNEADDLYRNPQTAYTQTLIQAIPKSRQ